MAEQVVIRQDSDLATEVLALDSENQAGEGLQSVEHILHLTPYGMLLAGLGTCTAMVINTYAKNHGVKLDSVELRLVYQRVFKEDCENCETIDRYTETIEEEIVLAGDLSPADRQRLYQVSKHCPIHKMVEQGLEVHSRLIE